MLCVYLLVFSCCMRCVYMFVGEYITFLLSFYAFYRTALGGQTAYTSVAVVESEPYEPRLFQCSNVSGCFKVH